MSGNMRLLEGEVEDPRQADDRIATLEEEITLLQSQLTVAKQETAKARRENARALSNLKRQLNPLYLALQDVFGELDAAGASDDGPGAPLNTPSVDARKQAIWESWKQRLGPTCAKVIDALLLQPNMDSRQLAVAIGTKRLQTVYDAIAKMNNAGLVDKRENRFSLKQL